MFASYYLHKFFKLYISQTKKLSQFLLLTVNISSQEVFSCSYSNSPSSRSSSKFKESSLERLVVGSSLIWKKGKLDKMTTRCHLLSLAVICCHTLSLVVPLGVLCVRARAYVRVCVRVCVWHLSEFLGKVNYYGLALSVRYKYTQKFTIRY